MSRESVRLNRTVFAMWKHLISFIVITIMLVGCNVNSSNNISDGLTIQKAEKSVESYIRNNYENVKTVKVGRNQRAIQKILNVKMLFE